MTTLASSTSERVYVDLGALAGLAMLAAAVVLIVWAARTRRLDADRLAVVGFWCSASSPAVLAGAVLARWPVLGLAGVLQTLPGLALCGIALIRGPRGVAGSPSLGS